MAAKPACDPIVIERGSEAAQRLAKIRVRKILVLRSRRHRPNNAEVSQNRRHGAKPASKLVTIAAASDHLRAIQPPARVRATGDVLQHVLRRVPRLDELV